MDAHNSPLQLSFAETMKGFVTKNVMPPDDYIAAARTGRATDTRIQFTVTITIAALDRFLAASEHVAEAAGMIRADGFTQREGAQVTRGLFKLFTEADNGDALKMRYLLPFTGGDGRPYLLDGFKTVAKRDRFRVLSAATTLLVVIRDGHGTGGDILATGVMRIHFTDVVRQLASFAVSGTRSLKDKARALIRFDRMFIAALWNAVRPRLRQPVGFL
jgi:cholesterol oxidase